MGSRVSAVPRGFRTPAMMPSAAWTGNTGVALNDS